MTSIKQCREMVEFFHDDLIRSVEAQAQAERLLYAEQVAGDPAGLVQDLIIQCREAQLSTWEAYEHYNYARTILKRAEAKP